MFLKLVLAIIIIFLISLVVYKLTQKEEFVDGSSMDSRCNPHTTGLEMIDKDKKTCNFATTHPSFYENSGIYLSGSNNSAVTNNSIGNVSGDDMSTEVPEYDIHY